MSELSPEQCHTHKHTHNRYNPLFNFDDGPNTATDHHNPFDYAIIGRKNFTHDDAHCHMGPRIGHDPSTPDDLKHTPIKKYYHVPDEPWKPWIPPADPLVDTQPTGGSDTLDIL